MHLKILRTAVFGGIVMLGLGSTQAALAGSQRTVVFVPCSTSTLITDMTSPASNTTLMLANDCTYTLTVGGGADHSGLPTVANTMTVVGNATTWIKRSTAEGTAAFSIFAVESTGNLTLDNVNVRNGGGSAYPAFLVVGGAIDNQDGTTTINGGTYTDNSVNTAEGPGEGLGGAIFSNGFLTVNAATFTDNSAYGGGAIYAATVDPTIRGGSFRQNYASGEGGAIYNDLGRSLTVTGVTFTDDSSDGGGGAIYNAGTLTLNGSTFSQNDSSDNNGGAIYNDDSLTINHGMISHNSAYDGGGLYNDAEGTVAITTSQITVNQASDLGGGIYNDNETTGSVTLSGSLMINGNVPDNCYPIGSMTGCTG